MDYLYRLDDPSIYTISQSTKQRPGAKAGLWCGLTLPVAMCLSCIKYGQSMTSNYSMATLCAAISTIYIYMNLLNKKPLVTHTVALLAALIGCLAIGERLGSILGQMSFLILISMKSYLLLSSLLKTFPSSFSIGEAIFVIQGMVVFTLVTILNCLDVETKLSTIFCQVFLVCTGLFLLGTNIFQLNSLIPYSAFLIAVMGALTLPTMYFTMEKNPISWFLLDFVFQDLNRVLLIGFWSVCTLLAVAVALRFGSGSSVTLTILRKYFHAIVIAIYVPGILIDVELLFVASVLIFAVLIILESMRLYKLELVGDILNNSVSGLLDEKDQGVLILTHIYLLVGCSLPVWIYPSNTTFGVKDSLLLFSGVISLGVGDTAASIGGTWWGRHRIPGTAKSVEGTLCSIFAQVIFVYILSILGILGTSQLPWIAVISSAIISSMVEALTTQVDNLVLPLVMYISLVAIA